MTRHNDLFIRRDNPRRNAAVVRRNAILSRTLRVTDGIGLEADLSLELEVGDPVISIERLASPFLLSGTGLDFNQRTYLDQEGNANGVYDFGDFRAFFLRNPDLPRAGDLQGTIELLVPIGALNGAGPGKEVVR